MKRYVFISFVLLVTSLNNVEVILAQNWLKLKPLVSTCKDVKAALKVKKCIPRLSDYKFPNHRITISFTEAHNPWRVPEGRVSYIYISFRNRIKLRDYAKRYGLNLTEFKKVPVSDVTGMFEYVDEKKQMTIETGFYGEEEIITGIALDPPKIK